ncbi:MAG: hypothetical protein FWD17_15010 [Polyangiaceae bacterium]|nr:hypothetical protein [Polyangiaceae bacterium]
MKRLMHRPFFALALFATLGGCHREPDYTLPPEAASPGVQLVQSTPGTIDIGGDATELCVIQSIAQFGHAAAPDAEAPSDASDDAVSPDDAGDAGDAAPPPSAIAQVNLYFDSVSETWHLSSSGPVSATIACAPWSKLGGAEALTRFDNGGGNSYVLGGYTTASPSQTIGTGGQTQCFLSDLEGDFVSDGDVASLDGAALTVSNLGSGGNAIYASATCFNGAQPVAYRDFPVDAVTGALSVPVLPDDQALCGLSAAGSFSDDGSSLVVSQGRALGFRAYGVVRCFLFDASDAEAPPSP